MSRQSAERKGEGRREHLEGVSSPGVGGEGFERLT